MATSNSTNFEPNVAEFIEEAFERCGVELRTGSDLKNEQRYIFWFIGFYFHKKLKCNNF